MTNILPIRFPGSDVKIYGGFWRRIAAYLLDSMLLLILGSFFYFFNKLDKTAMIRNKRRYMGRH